MKKFFSLLVVAILGGSITLGAYKYFEDEIAPNESLVTQKSMNTIPVSYSGPSVTSTNADFTEAAERTVHAVVHVKNVQISRRPRNIQEYVTGGGELLPSLVGAGSGVIISADGYIVTNNHVINGASEIEVSLNDNRTFKATVIGTDVKADIALIKIDSDKDFPYLPFGDSDSVRLGEWVLAVGNPFNLTSTVTAGIISAKARDIDEFDGNPQSFIQTDAAINPGNSGGALVNINGELIGINTAITSQTGSYVGYAFAVPSNTARKIVEDLIEYGDVQRGILGITGSSISPTIAQKNDLKVFEGVLVSAVENQSGAFKAGIKEGDIIRIIDNIKVSKFSDLTGYLSSKRPNDVVNVEVLRNGKAKEMSVKLIKLDTYNINSLGMTIRNADTNLLKKFNLDGGVVVSSITDRRLEAYEPYILTAIDSKPVKTIDDVQTIMQSKSKDEGISISFINTKGELNRLIRE